MAARNAGIKTFHITRGRVLRTTAATKTVEGAKVPAGTRVAAIETLGKGRLRVKVWDPTLPKLRWENIETTFDKVEKAARGRPAVEA